MEVQTLTTLLESLCHQATETEAPLIIDARIALTPEDARLVDLKTSSPLATIQY